MDFTDQNFADYTDSCVNDLLPLQGAFMELCNISSYEEWFYDHGLGIFHFKSLNGKKLYFKYVDVGSFSTATNTWNWSWDNKSTPVLVSKALEKVRVFGEANKFENLTQGLINGDEYTGWAMTAIAVKLLSAIGAYRIPHEHLFIY
jgi:hypothetical protein